MYRPHPIDTSDTVLPDDLHALAETIAKNAHEVWAASRIAEGWIYGEHKEDTRKTTPLLIPYDELPESEKLYDRNITMSTLKLVVKLGYTIQRTQGSERRSAADLPGRADFSEQSV